MARVSTVAVVLVAVGITVAAALSVPGRSQPPAPGAKASGAAALAAIPGGADAASSGSPRASSPSPSVTPSASPSPSDTTPPVTVVGGADDRWHRRSVTLTLTATDTGSGVAGTWYRIDGGPLNAGVHVVVPAPPSHAGDGRRVVSFFSIDEAGNAEAPQQVTVLIDTTPPKLRWVGLRPSLVTRQKALTARFVVHEASGRVAIRLLLHDQYGVVVSRRVEPSRGAGAGSLVVPLRAGHGPLAPGLYRLRLVLTDQAGNRAISTPAVVRDERPVAAKVTFDLPRAGRRLALTFDDGNDKAAWASIVGTLHAAHVHGTFFALGPRVAADGALARRTVAWGDAIGSHGWTHKDMALESAAQIRRELTKSEAAWWRVARASPLPFMRPPYGATGAVVRAAAGAAGYSHIMLWDVDPQDWTGISADEVAQRVLSHVHPGAIVCLHTLPNTATALPQILRGLRARGYREVSLPELFAAAARR